MACHIEIKANFNFTNQLMVAYVRPRGLAELAGTWASRAQARGSENVRWEMTSYILPFSE